MATSTPPPPYKGSWDERFLYYFSGVVATAHILVIGTNQILSGMVPTNSICGSTGIHSWEYWTIYGQAGLTILALAFFYSLLWHTLWRWWYVPSLFFTFGCFALHLWCTFWYITYQSGCNDHAQCWGTCNLEPNAGASGYWIAWWTLTGILTLICLIEGLLIVAIGRFTSVQALLLQVYGSNSGPFNYYERFNASYSSPFGIPSTTPNASKVGGTQSVEQYQPLVSETRPAGSLVYGNNHLEEELARAASLPPGSTVVGGSFTFQ